jgi:ribosome biogenesis GTPase
MRRARPIRRIDPLIEDYGWSDALREAFAPHAARGWSPARVIVQHRDRYRLLAEAGEIAAELSGHFAHGAQAGGYPVVGDWVAIEPRDGTAAIQAVLPRHGAFTRKAAGTDNTAQVVAANVDTALLVAALNADFNPRRLERYLAATQQSGAQPVVLLTKTDLCDDVPGALAAARAVVGDTPVLAVSVRTGEGMAALAAILAPRRTAVLLGSSGAGKSTLVNTLAGAEVMATQAIRESDGRGRHTTTHRQLVRLPSGVLLLDTPGMRELALWEAEAAVADLFEDIRAVAGRCRFPDCGHGAEPGCAVRAALETGELDPGRFASWAKLQRELAYRSSQEDPAIRAANRRRGVQKVKADRAARRRR